MQIDLNNPKDFTIDNVKKLIASEDDSVSTQIRVTINGMLYLSREVGNVNIQGLAFRLETFDAGNGYVGIQASNDIDWIHTIHDVVSRNWPKPSSTYIDSF